MLTVTAALILLAIPGYIVNRAFRVPALVALGAAPFAVLAPIVILAVLVPDAMGSGVAWTAIVWGVAVLASALGLIWFRGSARGLIEGWKDTRGAGLTAIVSSVAAIGMSLVAMGGLGTPLQRRDAVFHLNIVAGIKADWSTVDPLGLSGWLTGHPTSTTFYPSGFHSLAAALPGDPVVASNTVALLSIAIWIVGLTALVSVLLPYVRGAWFATPILALCTTSFPHISLFRHGQWAFALSLALLPALLAILVCALRERKIGFFALVSAGAISIAGTQPSNLAIPAFAVVCMGIAGLFARGSENSRYPSRRACWLIVGVGLLGYTALWFVPKLKSMANFERPDFRLADPLIDTIFWGHFHQWDTVPNQLSVVLAGLTVVGVVLLVKDLRTRWAGLMTVLMVAAVPFTNMDMPLRIITAPWYRDPERMQALATIFLVVAAAAAIGWLAQFVRTRLSRESRGLTAALAVGLTIVAIAPTAAGRLEVQYTLTKENFQGGGVYMKGQLAWDDSQTQWWRDQRDVIGDATVVADPASGGILLPATVGIQVFPAFPATDELSETGQDLLRALARGNEASAEVCEFVRDHDIQYVYVREAMSTRFGNLIIRRATMEKHGEVIDEWGDGALFRLTTCW